MIARDVKRKKIVAGDVIEYKNEKLQISKK